MVSVFLSVNRRIAAYLMCDTQRERNSNVKFELIEWGIECKVEAAKHQLENK